MEDTNATILIPDISGFTEFMTSSELDHASRAVHILVDTIIKAVGDEYEISEIEGDAVLMIKKGPAPSKKEILDTCLKIFNAFHFQRKWMKQHIICPCKACLAVVNLTLKFVAHYGPIAEIKVGRFITHSGTEMIVAHRLLKNSINNNEYLLITEKFMQQMSDFSEDIEMEWKNLSDEYASIGTIEYRFVLLNEARNKVPEPPKPQNYYHDDTPYFRISIDTNFRDVYMTVMNIPERYKWMPGLQKVEQDTPNVLVGSIHHCTFDDYNLIISPLRMTLTGENISYVESCRIEEFNVSLVYEFVFKKINEKECIVASRFMNAGESPIPKEINAALFEKLEQTNERLKDYCEKQEGRDAQQFN